MRKSELKAKIRELTWENLVQTCTISDQTNQIVQLHSKIAHIKTELEATKAANVLLQNENDAGMYRLADTISALINERDQLKEESENYKRLYFEQRHANDRVKEKIEELVQANFNEMVQRLSVISDLSFDFCKTLDDVAEEAKRDYNKKALRESAEYEKLLAIEEANRRGVCIIF